MKKLILVLFIFVVGCSNDIKYEEKIETNEVFVKKEEKQETIKGNWRVVKVRTKEFELPYEELRELKEELNVALNFTDKEVSFKVNNESKGTTGYQQLSKNKYQDNFKLFQFEIKGSQLEVAYKNTTLIFKKVI